MNSSDRWNMDRPAPAGEPPGAPAPRQRSWGLGQRRTFLVDRRSQLRTTVLAAVVVTTVLTVFLVTLHVSRERATEALVAHVPSLAETLAAQNRIEFTFQLAAAIVFLIMVVVVSSGDFGVWALADMPPKIKTTTLVPMITLLMVFSQCL